MSQGSLYISEIKGLRIKGSNGVEVQFEKGEFLAQTPEQVATIKEASSYKDGQIRLHPDYEEVEGEKVVDYSKLSKPKLAEYALANGGIVLDQSRKQVEMVADYEEALAKAKAEAEASQDPKTVSPE